MSGFDELVDHPGVGRTFSCTVVPGLGHAAPSGRVRLDALAGWLQDVALADIVDAGLAALWVVRRLRIRVTTFPRFGETATATTWCSGVGRMWAQRRTTIAVGSSVGVEAVALWVHLDPQTGRPFPLTPAVMDVYGPSAGGREVKARLRHAPPPAGAKSSPWTFRTTELDIADHVNNAAYWAPLESELLALGAPEPEAIDVEVEHRTPAQPGEHAIVADGAQRWIVGPDGGEVHASFAIAS